MKLPNNFPERLYHFTFPASQFFSYVQIMCLLPQVSLGTVASLPCSLIFLFYNHTHLQLTFALYSYPLPCFMGSVDMNIYSTVQFSSVAQSYPTLCDPMNCSMPGLPVHHQLLESTQTHVHCVGDAIQPSHPLSSPCPPALNLSQHQEMVVKAETSLESDTPMMNQLPFLEYDSAEDASYIFIPSDFESSTEMNPEAENHASVIKNDSYQQIDSESFFLTSEFGEFEVTPIMKHPTLAFSHRAQKSVLYICVSFSVLHIGLSLPSFKIPYICVSILSITSFLRDLHTRLFSSSSLSAIRMVSSAYLRLLIFLLALLIPACASSSPAFLMMYQLFASFPIFHIFSFIDFCFLLFHYFLYILVSFTLHFWIVMSSWGVEPFILFVSSNFYCISLLPVKVLAKEENSTENRPETMNHPVVLGNDSSQASSSSPVLMPSNFGYLGDPRRNIRMLDIHLMAVQKKAIPRHAACYLVQSLFSKEILISSSVGISSQGCQSLDPNKMAAIREHLAAVFPNYDLSEHGEEWQACISDINSLIHNLCSRTPKTVLNNGGPTKPKRDSNDKRDDDDNASSSQVSQQAAISETREQGNSPQNSRALPEGIQEPSTNGAAVSDETLEYLGDSRRNIQMPKSLLITAKEKSRPELSAIYLIRSLFTDEVLISSVHGSLGHGVYSLNANEINALREFLQDNYPTCDLSENGYDWKLCVMAINSCIHSLKCDLQKSTAESQSPPATTPSTESKLKDTDLAD
ncbi:hypothetical protein FD754_022502 [Muntiacus muntjak]|uniref:BEN domain-containing protein n=1 Tax=Muntiacus muntjak TaxID=9888 RepID=A0A5N3V8S6_MUNMU|nr:hypothetical protein FD754_022502 [Muntiacus muntjak]